VGARGRLIKRSLAARLEAEKKNRQGTVKDARVRVEYFKRIYGHAMWKKYRPLK